MTGFMTVNILLIYTHLCDDCTVFQWHVHPHQHHHGHKVHPLHIHTEVHIRQQLVKSGKLYSTHKIKEKDIKKKP